MCGRANLLVELGETNLTKCGNCALCPLRDKQRMLDIPGAVNAATDKDVRTNSHSVSSELTES